MLTRRDYSTLELRQRLQDRGYDQALVESALERCRVHQYLDDDRYAYNRAVSLLSQGRAVGPKIVSDLQRRGIAPHVAQQALSLAMQDFDEDQLLESLLARRYPRFDYAAAAPAERRRVVTFLQRRGFSLETIMNKLTQKGC
jgi:regulatory protein